MHANLCYSSTKLEMEKMRYNFKKVQFQLLMSIFGLAGCSGNFDFDMRDQLGGLLDTSAAASVAVANRPDPDTRGVITFKNYQVVVAKHGDRIGDLAKRINADPSILGGYNGISQDAVLRHGEIVVLPPSIVPTNATGKPLEATVVDISELSNGAGPTNQKIIVEPTRHLVSGGETAFTIARLYEVPVNILADWNGLDAKKSVRAGQYLLIPVIENKVASVSVPGQGSQTPTPPSSTQPQPQVDLQQTSVISTTTKETIADIGKVTKASRTDARFVRPVSGSIIRSYKKGQNEGIDIKAKSGDTVAAADNGIVAAVTKDTNGVPILVIKHADGLLTVYTNIDGLRVKKGEQVRRGQKIAIVGAGTPSFLHFEVRRGLVSVNPDDYI